ncbi:DUF1905 domain-containing protein [Propionibacteriaceae bacterium G1746]|uniref:DUF1905 domain-containing protein n=1 Tax=Aestuariimicrobium sp. G57 TaxID=3418485 RepID=UPI003C204EDE
MPSRGRSDDADLGEVSFDPVEFTFTGVVFEWRGPAPFIYVRVPDEVADEIHEEASRVTYGWGMIPGTLTIGATTWYTALFPKDGGYLVPLKLAVQRAEGIELGDTVEIRLRLGRD